MTPDPYAVQSIIISFPVLVATSAILYRRGMWLSSRYMQGHLAETTQRISARNNVVYHGMQSCEVQTRLRARLARPLGTCTPAKHDGQGFVV